MLETIAAIVSSLSQTDWEALSRKVFGEKYSSHELEILRNAILGEGKAHVFGHSENRSGHFVGAGGHPLGDLSPESDARYHSALLNLEERGLFRHASGPVYLLTESGWETAKKLVDGYNRD